MSDDEIENVNTNIKQAKQPNDNRTSKTPKNKQIKYVVKSIKRNNKNAEEEIISEIKNSSKSTEPKKSLDKESKNKGIKSIKKESKTIKHKRKINDTASSSRSNTEEIKFTESNIKTLEVNKKAKKSKKKRKVSQGISNKNCTSGKDGEVAETEKVRDKSKPKKLVWIEEFRDGRESISHNHPFKNVKLREPGPLKRQVSRIEWRAKACDFTRLNSLNLPINLIRYVQTGGPECRMPSECDERVNDLQWQQMKEGNPDLKYNFLVTSNALVYEGRGWKYQPEDCPDPTRKCIDVGFVGDYTKKGVPKVMKMAAEDLIDWGVYHYKIHCCHEVTSLLHPKGKENHTNLETDISPESSNTSVI